MSELGDVLGDDFASKYEETTQRRRDSNNDVSADVIKAICYKAVHGDGFDGENPRFTYKGGKVPHDVLLMETYDGDLGKFKNSFENGGMSFGMFHLDTLMSCAFNEDMLDLVNKIKPDSYYIVIGRYQEKTVMQDGSEETYYNINPVRAIIPLPQAKKFAEEYESDKDSSSIEEQKEDQGGSSAESESSEDTDESSEEDKQKLIVKVFNAIAEKKPEVLEAVADGDEDALNRLLNVVDDNLDQDVSESEVVDAFEDEIQEIEDGEEEEDDDLDIGGIDDLDESDDDADEGDGGSDNDNDDSSEDASDDGDDDSEESPDDWF